MCLCVRLVFLHMSVCVFVFVCACVWLSYQIQWPESIVDSSCNDANKGTVYPSQGRVETASDLNQRLESMKHNILFFVTTPHD